MSSALALPIKNTFVHFPEEPDSPVAPLLRSKTEQLSSARRRSSSTPRVANRTAFGVDASFGFWRDSADSSSEEDLFEDELQVERVASTQSTAVDEEEEAHFCQELQMCRVSSNTSTAADEAEVEEAYFSKELKMGRVLSNQSSASDSSAGWDSDYDECSVPAAAVITPAAALVQPQPLQWVALADIGMGMGASMLQPACLSPCTYNCTVPVGTLANVAWDLPMSEVSSTQNKVCSSEFSVPLPGYGPCPFQIILYAEDRMCRGGAAGDLQGFQGSEGRGRAEVRCLAKLPAGTGRVVLDVTIASMPSKRGPITHDFAKKVCCGWRRMDFLSGVDPATQSLRVCANFTLPQ